MVKDLLYSWLVKVHPKFVAMKDPEWMGKHYPHRMVKLNAHFMAARYPEKMCEYYPDMMFRELREYSSMLKFNPEWIIEHEKDWLVPRKPFLLTNHPNVAFKLWPHEVWEEMPTWVVYNHKKWWMDNYPNWREELCGLPSGERRVIVGPIIVSRSDMIKALTD
jgi:hypothetical protein